jgi:hypothetical protein
MFMNDDPASPETGAPSSQTVAPEPPVGYTQPVAAPTPAVSSPRFSKKKIALVCLTVLIIATGAYAWYGKVYHAKNSAGLTYSDACSTIVQTTNNQSFQLPSGWGWYEIKDIGLKYAYPKSWGSLTTQTNSGVEKYVASFTIGSSGANTMVSLSPSCSDFQATLSDINNNKFDTLSGPTTTRAIKHNQSSYSSLSHWSNDAGNQYQLITHDVASAGSIKSVVVDYSVVTGSQSCPDDRLASSDQPKCINQSISDEVDKVISSLQKI